MKLIVSSPSQGVVEKESPGDLNTDFSTLSLMAQLQPMFAKMYVEVGVDRQVYLVFSPSEEQAVIAAANLLMGGVYRDRFHGRIDLGYEILLRVILPPDLQLISVPTHWERDATLPIVDITEWSLSIQVS